MNKLVVQTQQYKMYLAPKRFIIQETKNQFPGIKPITYVKYPDKYPKTATRLLQPNKTIFHQWKHGLKTLLQKWLTQNFGIKTKYRKQN